MMEPGVQGAIHDRCPDPVADGAVVGSFFKDTGKDTGDVSAGKIELLMQQVRALRGTL